MSSRYKPFPLWLSVQQVAKYIGVSKETIYRFLENKQIPSYRIGKLWRFHSAEIDGWIINGGASELATRSRTTKRAGVRRKRVGQKNRRVR